MVDGRIDTKDTVENLRSRGILGKIAALEEDEMKTRMGGRDVASVQADDRLVGDDADADGTAPTINRNKPRVLVQAEHRATGQIKWPIYNAYLRASYGPFALSRTIRVAHQCAGLTGLGTSCSCSSFPPN